MKGLARFNSTYSVYSVPSWISILRYTYGIYRYVVRVRVHGKEKNVCTQNGVESKRGCTYSYVLPYYVPGVIACAVYFGVFFFFPPL